LNLKLNAKASTAIGVMKTEDTQAMADASADAETRLFTLDSIPHLVDKEAE
jgi:hypothetical protein